MLDGLLGGGDGVPARIVHNETWNGEPENEETRRDHANDRNDELAYEAFTEHMPLPNCENTV
ncbi:MAG: hypothetical protein CUN54_10740 [Phototrophicales bacterium]|nr:MAG: hypothetical protein CUN54_10740 [Phototrophicales bacterium]